MSQYQELLAQSQELQAKIEEARKAELSEVIPQIHALMVKYKVKPEDLGFVLAPRKRAVKVRYQNAEGQTWSGRGRKPEWVQAILDVGGNIEDYAVDKAQGQILDSSAVGQAETQAQDQAAEVQAESEGTEAEAA